MTINARLVDTKIITDKDGKHRVWGWINLAAPEKARRLAEARRLWGTMPNKVLSREVGVPVDALRRHCDEAYQRHVIDRINLARAKKNGWKGYTATESRRPDQGDVAQRLAAIPEDTRTLSQRLNGDPLPGRSALDQRRRA